MSTPLESVIGLPFSYILTYSTKSSDDIVLETAVLNKALSLSDKPVYPDTKLRYKIPPSKATSFITI